MGEDVAPIYVELASESDDPHVTQLPSLCMACHNMGTTRLLMTRIPHYKEVILTSFACDHCGESNSGCQSSGVAERGVTYRVEVRDAEDLARQVVRSENATVTVPELELEIPATSEKGEVTTVEGLLNQTKLGLSRDQEARRSEHPEVAAQIEKFLVRLTDCLTVTSPFTLIIDDPSGNSFMENPLAPKPDPKLTKKVYHRTPEQNSALGLSEEAERIEEEAESGGDKTEEPGIGNQKNDELKAVEDSSKEAISNDALRIEKNNQPEEEAGSVKGENLKDEVLVFSSLCDRCFRPTNTNMKVVQIPYFKEVIIMALHCDGCGNRTNEVKSGSGVGDKGRRVTLTLTHSSDLTRDVLKSDTCDLCIPELDLTVGGGLLGGKFTTVEGLIRNVRDDLASNPFLAGDSAQSQRKEILDALLDKLDKITSGELFVTLILDDPAGNSYVQNLYAPDPDPHMTCEEYTRTHEQNDDLGLTHMKTENYQEDNKEGTKEEA